MTDFPNFKLSLFDGTSIMISPYDEISSEVVSFFSKVGQLSESGRNDVYDFRINVKKNNSDSNRIPKDKGIFNADSREKIFYLDHKILPRLQNRDSSPYQYSDGSPTYLSEEEWMWRQMSCLSSIIAGCVLPAGGFLVHSGLIEYLDEKNPGNAKGILLAGASGSGKTTASKMLNPPWFSLSDDLTLVVKDFSGQYFAHPFPTWSRFLGKEDSVENDSWEIEKYLPLTSVIFLERNKNSGVSLKGKGESLSLLTELVKQANSYFVLGLERQFIPEFNRNFFINVYNMIKVMNCYSYNLKIDGSFWKEVEDAFEITG